MVSMKNFKLFLKTSTLVILAFSLFGCATLSYSGEDYNSDNTQTVKTNEDFVFDTYKKTIDNANVKIGITRTSVPEILALYVQVENLSYESPYMFKVEDLNIFNPEKELPFITTNNYLSIWQQQEASAMSSVGTFGNTLTTMTGMNANYNDFNQAIAQKNTEESNQSAFQRLDEIGSNVLKHTIKISSQISPRKSQYFYFFFEDTDKFPIKVVYKSLEYQFKL